MRSLQLHGDRDLRLEEIDPPPPPAAGEVQIRIRAIGLNYLDIWGFRGMAFAKRKMPQAAGVEASGEIVCVGEGVTGSRGRRHRHRLWRRDLRPLQGLPRGPRQSLRERRRRHGLPYRRLRPRIPEQARQGSSSRRPKGVSFEDAACAPIGFGTVQHMLFDNAKLEPGESVLVHAGGSGIGTAAILMAKAIGCTVYTTVGDDEKGRKAKELGADYVVNYKTERFEGEVRQLTKRKGVDVVFEHVGADTWNGSLLCLKRGGRLVTCGATSGASATINLMQLFQQQYRITGSFGCRIENISAIAGEDGRRHEAGDRLGLPARGVREGPRPDRGPARSSARSSSTF